MVSRDRSEQLKYLNRATIKVTNKSIYGLNFFKNLFILYIVFYIIVFYSYPILIILYLCPILLLL